MQAADKGLACGLCKSVVDYAKVYSALNEDQIGVKVKEHVCAKFSYIESICNKLVDKYMPHLHKYLQTDASNVEICANIKLCDEDDSRGAARSVGPAAKGVRCNLCKKAFAYGKQFSTLSAAQVAVKVKAKICAPLGFIEATCNSLIDQHMPTLYPYLQTDTTAQEACTTTSLCN
jgi:hypothetical protein